MDNPSNGMRNGEYEAVVQDVKNLKADTAALAGQLQNKASDTVNGTLRRIEDTVSDIWDTISRTGAQSYEAVERNVEQRPFAVMLAAFVAGAAIGWVLDRKATK